MPLDRGHQTFQMGVIAQLVASPADRERLLADKGVQRLGPTPEQAAILARIRQVLGAEAAAAARR